MPLMLARAADESVAGEFVLGLEALPTLAGLARLQLHRAVAGDHPGDQRVVMLTRLRAVTAALIRDVGVHLPSHDHRPDPMRAVRERLLEDALHQRLRRLRRLPADPVRRLVAT